MFITTAINGLGIADNFKDGTHNSITKFQMTKYQLKLQSLKGKSTCKLNIQPCRQ